MWLIKYIILIVIISATLGEVRTESEETNELRLFISYYLFNPEGNSGPYYTASQEIISAFNPKLPTAVLIHDHRGHFRDDFSTTVRKGFIDNHDINVFVVDWAFEAGDPYYQVLKVISRVAADVANFLEILRKLKDTRNNDDVHLIGFGIGAHIAGEVGHKLGLAAGIARITGLDPTGRDHNDKYPHLLSSNDASYVEVIHTDGGALGYGIGREIGHVDFFVNRGANQPICLTNLCNHNRAWEVFAASLKYDHFIGNRCITFEEVGLNTCEGFSFRLGGAEVLKVPMLPGIYRVNTGRQYPFKFDNFGIE